MKKFTQINESNKSVETSTNKKDFMKNLIDESLSIENGEIKGKESLVKTLNRIMELNDSKTTIKVLENIKAMSFHTMNFEFINEAIEAEKKKMCANPKECECEEKAEKLDKEKEEKVEESINEGKTEIEIEVTVKPCEGEEGEEGEEPIEIEEPIEDEEGEKELIMDEFEDPTEEEEENMFVEESVNFMSDIHNLSKLMESLDSLNEDHLEGKNERINYILSRFTDKKVEEVVLEKISALPDYVKTADIEQTLANLSDEELEKLYFAVEKTK